MKTVYIVCDGDEGFPLAGFTTKAAAATYTQEIVETGDASAYVCEVSLDVSRRETVGAWCCVIDGATGRVDTEESGFSTRHAPDDDAVAINEENRSGILFGWPGDVVGYGLTKDEAYERAHSLWSIVAQ